MYCTTLQVIKMNSRQFKKTSNLTYKNRISQIHTDVIPDKKVHMTLYDQEDWILRISNLSNWSNMNGLKNITSHDCRNKDNKC